MRKPPIGIMPKKLHREQRFYDICEAISKRYMAEINIPIEWVEEYNELLDGKSVSDKKWINEIQNEVEKLKTDLYYSQSNLISFLKMKTYLFDGKVKKHKKEMIKDYEIKCEMLKKQIDFYNQFLRNKNLR